MKTRDIIKKLSKMSKSELRMVCQEMKCNIGSKKEMITRLVDPLLKGKYNFQMESKEEEGKEEEMSSFNDETIRIAVNLYLNNKEEAIAIYGDISNWDTRNVTDMSGIFYGAAAFNQPIGNWDVSNVTNMDGMFYGAVAFNQPIGNWDTSNVTNMSGMFARAFAFNQPIGNWDTSNVTNMSNMFEDLIYFNQPIGNWDTRNVTDMSEMFLETKSFNQPIGNWNVGNVTSMSSMFYGVSDFNQPIGNWDVSNVTDMSGMFYGVSDFNQPIGNWNVGNVTDIGYMFTEATSFNQPIGNWNVGNVTNMSGMFSHATSFNQPIGNWNVGNVTNMDGMFAEATSFNQPIGNWNVGNVTDMSEMFREATSFNQPIGNWNVGNVTDMVYMFSEATSFNQPIGGWNVGNVTGMDKMFAGASSFDQDLNSWNVTINCSRFKTFIPNHFNEEYATWYFQTRLESGLPFQYYNSMAEVNESPGEQLNLGELPIGAWVTYDNKLCQLIKFNNDEMPSENIAFFDGSFASEKKYSNGTFTVSELKQLQPKIQELHKLDASDDVIYWGYWKDVPEYIIPSPCQPTTKLSKHECKNDDVLTMEPFKEDDKVVRLNILNDDKTIGYWCLSKDFIKFYCSQALIDNPPYCEWEGAYDDSGHGGSCGNLKLLQIPSRGGETWMITVKLGRKLLKAANSHGSLEVGVKKIKQVSVGATHNEAGGSSTSHGNTKHWVWGCRRVAVV